MSGGSGGGGGVRVSDEAPCERHKFEAQITSPQPAVVATISVGEVLDVVLNNRQGSLVVEVHKAGNAAGGLAGPDASRLRTCIIDGHVYRATVLVVNGGQVRVRIEHA